MILSSIAFLILLVLCGHGMRRWIEKKDDADYEERMRKGDWK